MQDVVEISAKTVEEALELALKQMGARMEEVEVEVLSRGKPGFLGFGAEPARVRVRRLPSADTPASTAKGILDRLLALMKVQATATIGKAPEEAPDTVLLNIEGEDAGLLIGRRGETLRSLQFLVAVLLSRRVGNPVPLMVDVEHYRERRNKALRDLALRVAERVTATGHPVTLEPMTAYERRLIHLALTNHPRVITQSVGEGEERKVSILPRRPRPVRPSHPGPPGTRVASTPSTPQPAPPPSERPGA